MKRSYHFSSQQGIALVVVLLIVAVISIIAVEMSARLQLNVARTLNLKANNQAYWYALGAEQFAKKSLLELNSLTPNNTNLSQPWAETFEYPVEGGTIKAQLSDMQACFNLNAVTSAARKDTPNTGGDDDSLESNGTETNPVGNPQPDKEPPPPFSGDSEGLTESQRSFELLLQTFINDSLIVDTIRDSVIDWIDADSTPNNYGAEDADYESQANPYLSANSLFGHVSELRLINGVGQAIQLGKFQDLTKALCVIPGLDTLEINVNTIARENAVVLTTLLGETSGIGADIIDSRGPEGFNDIQDFLSLPEVQALQLSQQREQWFKVTTKYFRLNTTAKVQGSQFTLSSIFKVEEGQIEVIGREFGGAL